MKYFLNIFLVLLRKSGNRFFINNVETLSVVISCSLKEQCEFLITYDAFNTLPRLGYAVQVTVPLDHRDNFPPSP